MISINTDLCTACEHCVEECPSFILKMEGNIPVMTFEKGCIACGHCVAVCPEGALDHSLAPLKKQVKLQQHPVIDEVTAEYFLRSRRSIRNFKEQKVEREKILNILNVVRFAPSGGNSQGISYLVVDDKEKLRQVSLLTQQWITEADKADGSRRFRFYKIYIDRNMSLGIDVVLRAAPVLIAGLAKRSLENGFSNTRFSLAYAELYVTTQGLASCWAGFFEMAGLADYKPMKELLNIPDDQVITGGIILGYPKNTYHRLVDRNPLKVSFLG